MVRHLPLLNRGRSRVVRDQGDHGRGAGPPSVNQETASGGKKNANRSGPPCPGVPGGFPSHSMEVFTQAEAAAALFQASVTLVLALLFAFLSRRYRKPHFFWWSVAFGLYGLGLAAIVTFLVTGVWAFLYWHQVVTGWTALGLLYAALVFERQLRWRPRYAAWLAFPLVWAYLAIFILDNFGLAAGATVTVAVPNVATAAATCAAVNAAPELVMVKPLTFRTVGTTVPSPRAEYSLTGR